MMELRNAYKIVIAKRLKVRHHLEDVVVEWVIILQQILEKKNAAYMWSGFNWLRIG
jgi:hypothetical protein